MSLNNANEDKKAIRKILFYEAHEALNQLRKGDLLAPESWDNLSKLFEDLLITKPNMILFLGAGTTMSIEKNEIETGAFPFQPYSWEGLLKKLFLGLGENRQKKFLEEQSDGHEDKIKEWRSKSNGDWFDIIKNFKDKPTLAWSIGLYYSKLTARNKVLYQLVSSPFEESSDFKSATLEQIVKLPFNDIITTNFDPSLTQFLEKEDVFREEHKSDFLRYRGYEKKQNKVVEIFDQTSFLQSITKQPRPRLFYIHGKADENGNNFLVFDKFEFAKLLSDEVGMLNYLINQFLFSTVIYFGFGLDDQTFNFIQEKLSKILKKASPKKDSHEPDIEKLYSYSFSTQISETEIAEFEKNKFIRVIKYNDHKKLPVILNHINTILEYFRQSPENEIELKFPSDEKNVSYQNRGRKEYLSANYKDGLKYYRLAFATLLFPSDPSAAESSWENNKNIIQIRRYLALNLSKIRWKTPFTDSERVELLEGTVSRAEELLEKCEQQFKNNLDEAGKLSIEAQKVSLKVLRARVKAHEGNIRESFNRYREFEEDFKNNPVTKKFLRRHSVLLANIRRPNFQTFKIQQKEVFDRDIRQINRDKKLSEVEKKKQIQEREETYYDYGIDESIFILGYSYIFAREQRKRHNSFLNSQTDVDEEKYIKNYTDLIELLVNKENSKFFKDEFSISLETLGGVLVISLWEIGTRLIRYSSDDFLPNENPDFYSNIGRAIELFDHNEEDYNLKKKYIYINEKTPLINILPSERWQTRMYRHKCRAYMLRWVKMEENQRRSGNKDDLLLAFTSFKKALDLSSKKETLRSEFLKNCLESVRMNTLTMLYTSKEDPSYALSEAACYYYSNQAVEIIYKLLDPKNDDLPLNKMLQECSKPGSWHIWWLLIFIFKTVSYFNLLKISNTDTKLSTNLFTKKVLKDFLSDDPAIVLEVVVALYKEYSKKVMDDEKALDGVIKKYTNDYKKFLEIAETAR